MVDLALRRRRACRRQAAASGTTYFREITTVGIKASKELFLAGIVAAFLAVPATAGTWNPTASDNSGNTAGGTGALPENSANLFNTAFGYYALGAVTNGGSDTAFGTSALGANTSGAANTAVGDGALGYNTTGSNNTAVGLNALFYVSTGQFNTGTGSNALGWNNTGSGNTATGYGALGGAGVIYGINEPPAGTSSYNTAAGYYSLIQSTTGGYNVGNGSWSLYGMTSGIGNVGVGTYSLYSNSTSSLNTAVGIGSLYETTGGDNIGVGQYAGYYNTSGSYNIDIGNYGQSSDANTIRVGTSGYQTKAFIAGISGVNLSGGGSEVYINSSGQLGTVNSSARYKQDIADMADESTALSKLRPVTFDYKSDPTHEKQYGLIAEEVAAVYPNLVVRNTDGQIESVRYYELAPMLLNEMQKQQKTIQEQQAAIQQLSDRLARLESGR